MEKSKAVVVIHAPAHLDSKHARQFMGEILAILHSDRPQVVVDLSQVKSMDSAGVDVLVGCVRSAMRRDGEIKLAALPPQAAVVLELTRADRLFEIYDNVANAVMSFTGFLPNILRAQQQRHHAAA